jgi:hypothetical protein
MGVWALTAGMFIIDFMFSIQVAAALVTDVIQDIIEAACNLSPDSDSWEEQVVGPALKLPRYTMTALSNGWSRGLLILFIGCWLLTVAIFGAALSLATGSSKDDPTRVVIVILIDFLILLLPLQMSRCVAQVSSGCDDLMNTLNDKRLDNLGDSERLRALELALKSLNNEQGLGFVIADDTVLDRRVLRNMFFSVASVFGTLAPILFSIVLTATDSTNAAMYGALPGNSTIYALSNHHRTYEESVEFCRSLWMRPASIGSQAENNAMVRLIYKVGLNYGENWVRHDAVYLGARRRASSTEVKSDCTTWPDDCSAVSRWAWEDGTDMQWFHAGFRSGSPQTDRLMLSPGSPRCDDARDEDLCQLKNTWYYEGIH